MIDKKEEWIEFAIYSAPVIREIICSILFDLGSTGIIEPSNKDDPIVSYFPPEADINSIRSKFDALLKDALINFPEIKNPVINIRAIKKEDYSRVWKRFFRADRITENLLIVPPWETRPSFNGNIMILDPGPAFGTGKHPSTRLCLKAMETIDSWMGANMLDVGTGSGILAIYGVILGAERVVAIDIDEDALRWAKKNAIFNNSEAKIGFVVSLPNSIRNMYNIITANLTFEIISSMIGELIRLLEKDGYIILSGILNKQLDDTERLLKLHSLRIEHISSMEEWVCFKAKKS